MKSESELRDYFAGQALNGRISNGWGSACNDYGACKRFYEIADAMLLARDAKERSAKLDRELARDAEAEAKEEK